MAGPEDEDLQDERPRYPGPPVAEPIADEGGAGQGHGAEEALLPESGLQRGRERGEPGQHRGQRVGVDEDVGRRPPAQVADGDPIEADDEREVDADDQVAGHRLPQHRPRPRAVPGPAAPELQVMRKRLPGQALGGHEREGEDAGEHQEQGDLRRHLLDREGGLGHRGVVAHPHQGPLVEAGDELGEGDGGAPDERHAPQHPPLPQQDEQPHHDAAAVDEQHDEAAGDVDALVGRAHLLVAAVEGLGHLEEVRQLGEPVAAHDEAQPETPLPRLNAGPLVDERVVDASARTLGLGRLDQGVTIERDVPGRAGPGLGDGAGRVGVEGHAPGVFRQNLAEAVRRPVGAEAHLGLAHLAAAEVSDDPLVGVERAVAQQPPRTPRGRRPPARRSCGRGRRRGSSRPAGSRRAPTRARRRAAGPRRGPPPGPSPGRARRWRTREGS